MTKSVRTIRKPLMNAYRTSTLHTSPTSLLKMVLQLMHTQEKRPSDKQEVIKKMIKAIKKERINMAELQFESILTMEEIEENFVGIDFFTGIMDGLEEALAYEKGQLLPQLLRENVLSLMDGLSYFENPSA